MLHERIIEYAIKRLIVVCIIGGVAVGAVVVGVVWWMVP